MITNTKIINFSSNKNEQYGTLVALEELRNIPFSIRRIYYIFGVPKGETRGHHSHNELEQVLICVSGSVKLTVSTPDEHQTILLDKKNEGLYIGPMIWRVMSEFSQDAVLLVLASQYYDEDDYIRDHSIYIKKAKEYFLER